MRLINKNKVSVLEDGQLHHTDWRITIGDSTVTLLSEFEDAKDVAIANMINHELRLINKEDINVQELENIKSFPWAESTEQFVPVVVTLKPEPVEYGLPNTDYPKGQDYKDDNEI